MLASHGLWLQWALRLKGPARVGGWGKQEASLVFEGIVVREAYSSSFMIWYGGWLGYWACQKFRAFEIVLTTEEPMHGFQLFSRWHNLFNDSGNSSLLNHFLNRNVCTFPAHFLVSDFTFSYSKCIPALEMLFPLVNCILKVANSGASL